MASRKDVDTFKEEFKYYKKRKPPPDLSGVIDFSRPGDFSKSQSADKVIEITLPEIKNEETLSCFKPVSEWKVFSMKDVPGFTFIVNPFLPGYQRYWVHRCLQDYTCKPNICNLDAHTDLSKVHSIWHHSQRDGNQELIKKLRWVTLGYQYDWNTKKYYADRVADFPDDLSMMCEYVTRVLGFSDFRAEAAIVNFYHQDSTLAGHTDHSELNHSAPLVSVSFGQPAIFLFGGTTKAVKPTAMFIRSGDVVIMSGASRLCYHAVPRILSDDSLSVMDLPPPSDKTSQLKQKCDANLPENAAKVEPMDSSSDKETVDILHGIGCKRKISDLADRKFTNQDGCHDSRTDSVVKREIADTQFTKRQCENKDYTDESTVFLVDSTSERNQTNSAWGNKVDKLNQNMDKLLHEIAWQPYAAYLQNNRINVNVRQVFQGGAAPNTLSNSCD